MWENVVSRRMTWESQPKRVKASYSKLIYRTASRSRAGHEKSCLKIGGPSSKAKYYPLTDSEPVP